MEQNKILKVDFERVCKDKKVLVREAISKIKEKVAGNDREEWDKSMKEIRVILGKGLSTKEMEERIIHMVPVLIMCGCMYKYEGPSGGNCQESRVFASF